MSKLIHEYISAPPHEAQQARACAQQVVVVCIKTSALRDEVC